MLALNNPENIYILGIDTYVHVIENVVSIYHPPPTEDVVYSVTSRGPVATRAKAEILYKNNLITDTPTLPWMCLTMLGELIELSQLYNIVNPEVFRRNGIDNNGMIVYKAYSANDYEDVISAYFPNIPYTGVMEIADIYKSLYMDNIKPIHDTGLYNIYRFDYSTVNYKLIKYMDVRAFRYNELLENQKVERYE